MTQSRQEQHAPEQHYQAYDGERRHGKWISGKRTHYRAWIAPNREKDTNLSDDSDWHYKVMRAERMMRSHG